MQALLFKKKLKMAGACIHLFWWKKNDISELIEDSDAENTKKQRKYAVSRMYLKNYDISCLINSFAKSNSLFWYYIKQIMNVFIRAMVRIFSFGERWNVLFNSAIASLNRTFHLSPHENILTIALINIHYLYIMMTACAAAYWATVITAGPCNSTICISRGWVIPGVNLQTRRLHRRSLRLPTRRKWAQSGYLCTTPSTAQAGADAGISWS